MNTKNHNIYLDYNATTPVDPKVVAAMMPYLDGGTAFGNPSRSHWAGSPAKQAILHAKEQVASLIGATPDEIVFTGGGSETVNLAIKGIFLPYFKSGTRNHVITSQIEHPASMMACRFLKEYLGAEISEIPVDANGVVDVEEIRKVASPNTALINIQHANHEMGAIQPIEEISKIAKEHGIVFHTDAVCSVGKNIVDVTELGCDLLSLSGHKFYAPKGIAALYVSNKLEHGLPGLGAETRMEALISGILPRGEYRAGTPNVAAIVGMGKACELAENWNTSENRAELASKRDFFCSRLQEEFGTAVVLIAHPDSKKRVCNNANLSFPGQIGNEILSKLNNLAASSGPKTEQVVLSLGYSDAIAKGAIRFSLGKMTTFEELNDAVNALKSVVQ